MGQRFGRRMVCLKRWSRCIAALSGTLALMWSTPLWATALDLHGYADAQGAISVQYKGDTVDPYFALQALLLAHDSGLDISGYAMPWANWLLQRQKPDASFDRFCRNGPVWAPCKTADADDSQLALWLRLLDTPVVKRSGKKAFHGSQEASHTALARLLDPVRGVYLVSPVYQHGLLMDNLEVLSWQNSNAPARAGKPQPSRHELNRNILRTFWDAGQQGYLVSTQPEQKTATPAFYPDHVAQVLPLLFDFKVPGIDPTTHYRNWMREHRASWLKQSHHDFAWGLIAVIALKANDHHTAACWLRETAAAQRTSHWIVTDEVVRQILTHNQVTAAAASASCL